MSDAAHCYDGAARELFGRTPEPLAAGTGLREAGRLLPSVQVAKPSEVRQLLALLVQLAALTDTVTGCGRLNSARRESRQLAGPPNSRGT
ncbi:MAG: hypothetical protein JWN08_3670 [Frankiales bacterium]|nr:hypothetical protein [Frankiales bacterium]